MPCVLSLYSHSKGGLDSSELRDPTLYNVYLPPYRSLPLFAIVLILAQDAQKRARPSFSFCFAVLLFWGVNFRFNYYIYIFIYLYIHIILYILNICLLSLIVNEFHYIHM